MYFLLISCLVGATLGATVDMQLPNYMKACKKKDFDACVLKTSNSAIAALWKGEQKLKVPVLDPYRVKKIEITENGEKSIAMNITFIDLDFYGLKNAKLVSSKTDFKKNNLEWTFSIPKLRLAGKQKTSGKVLLLPIVGEGPIEMNLIDVTATYRVDWVIENRKGKQWMKPKNGNLDYSVKGLKSDFKGLFNGDKALEKNMNEFLNENWEELVKALGPSMSKALANIMSQIVEGITKIVPWNNLVL